MYDELTLEERKVIYRARRGLKEIDVYFDPYVKQYYLQAEPEEKAMFAELVEQEDPDLLDWLWRFLNHLDLNCAILFKN